MSLHTGHNGIGEMLVPEPWRGEAKHIPFEEYCWIKNIQKKVWCRLFEKAPSFHNDFYLPDGYDLYIVSFHLEPVDILWVDQVGKNTKSPLIVLADIIDPCYPVSENIQLMSYVYWHRQIELSMCWHPKPMVLEKNIKYKASALCNRITQSKMLITTALLEEMGDDSLIRLSTWLEEKNIHFKQLTGNKNLDNISDIYWKKYHGKEIVIDKFTNHNHNYQKLTINPWVPFLQNCALHFTNETLAYSFMMTDSKQYIYPGPFLTEKTLKCLLAGTAFIPVGQYNTYGFLKKLGLDFNYPFDTSWDNDIGNLTRLESIINLIKYLKNYSAQELFEMTNYSSTHNFDIVWSGEFSNNCKKQNTKTIEEILSKFG